jgi:hypothetical protein
MYFSEHIWAASIRAYKINNGYFRDDTDDVISNKQLLKNIINNNRYPDDDIKEGITCKMYFQKYLFLELDRSITSIQRKILEISQIDYFNLDNEFYFAIIAFLPYLAEKEIANKCVELHPFSELKYKPGDTIAGQIEVIHCEYDSHYQKYEIEASFEDTIVEWKSKYEIHGIHQIKAKVRWIKNSSNKICKVRYLREH